MVKSISPTRKWKSGRLWGGIQARDDVNHDGAVNVADVQKAINAAGLRMGCAK